MSGHLSKPNTQGYPQEQWITQQILLTIRSCGVIPYCEFSQ
ncbi:hypothetical protein XIS1_610018 [Xenorhabdus innexi]|uniref:Uncharacterized protein n=1 Tax=Xenorhabdus innexi TaxID=290109 RepID=A0A1N6N012_9GAMM|nr:hypothetical protein XIS1_610018 [Xenorhabdus innexi]